MNKVSPRVDIAFKKLFGVEENKDLLISLINSIISVEDQVADLTILNPYNAQNFKSDKLSILDIKAKSIDGKRFNIEIQISDEADYDKRSLYYWAKLYVEQLKSADDYSLLTKTIGIHILNFISIPEVDKYHNVFHITEDEHKLTYFQDLELHTIELKKFVSEKAEFIDLVASIKNSLDLWVAFLTRHELLNTVNTSQLPKNLDSTSIEKALDVINVMNFNEEEREAYENHLKWLRIEANTLKKMEDKGRAEGREEGRAEGREEGRAEGREEGRIEGIKKTAAAMKTKGLDFMLINEVTKLTIEEINEL